MRKRGELGEIRGAPRPTVRPLLLFKHKEVVGQIVGQIGSILSYCVAQDVRQRDPRFPDRVVPAPT